MFPSASLWRTVTQNNRLMLRAEVSEKYYQSLPVIRSANFRTPYDDQTYQLSELHGRLLSYGKSVRHKRLLYSCDLRVRQQRGDYSRFFRRNLSADGSDGKRHQRARFRPHRGTGHLLRFLSRNTKRRTGK